MDAIALPPSLNSSKISAHSHLPFPVSKCISCCCLQAQSLLFEAACMQRYYAAMQGALGMLTAFPGDRYYTEAASSTVATAISLGVRRSACCCCWRGHRHT